VDPFIKGVLSKAKRGLKRGKSKKMDKLKMVTTNNTDKNSITKNFLNINDRIFVFRDTQVMIDKDLAELYGVETKRLNEQVKRNIERFPEEFRFQLTTKEKSELVANCDRFETLKHSTSNPYAFTEQGVAMLSAVLNSKTAINISIRIIKAFVEMRKFLLTNAKIFQRLDKLELKQIEHKKDTEDKFEILFDALEKNELTAKQGIFFEGQIFDAYLLVSDIIRSANESIILIDNYIDDTVIKMFTKQKKEVITTFYSNNINETLKNDINKYNAQYTPIILKELKTSHDRFLIIDKKIVYHFGASLKDAGKKWFAFSKLLIDAKDIMDKLKGC
jgi:phage regulator Rha-like protein